MEVIDMYELNTWFVRRLVKGLVNLIRLVTRLDIKTTKQKEFIKATRGFRLIAKAIENGVNIKISKEKLG